MTTPNPGTVSISEGPITETPPTGFNFLGQEVVITAPAASTTNPLSIEFRIHTSIGGTDPNAIEMFKGGTGPIAACSGTPGEADPDPCVDGRSLDGDDIVIVVLTSTASGWNIGLSVATPTATATATATPTPTATATATATATPTPTATATATPLPPGVHDADLRRIQSSFSVLGSGSPDFREMFVQVRNVGDHAETIGVVLDVRPPLDPNDPGNPNPFGCLPNGRIMATTVTLAAGSQANVRAEFGSAAGKVEFSCTDQAGAAGKFYKLFAAVDVHADDINLSDKTLGPCPELGTDDSTCGQALANDDLDSDNRDDRSAPRVKPP